MNFEHTPVMLNEVIEYLNIKSGDTVVDCTLGGAGHSSEILKLIGSDGLLIGIDRDTNALKAAEKKLSVIGDNYKLVHSNFSKISEVLMKLDIKEAEAILMDLGVSSHQLDEEDRGFSYKGESRLDMRMDETQRISAWDIVNTYSEDRLKMIIKSYGEEKWAARIAKFIIDERPIDTTKDLVDVIFKAIPAGARQTGPHPARRTFQAVRMEVNKELESIDEALDSGIKCLAKGGRMAVITFHSLEDRMVKQKFRLWQDPCTCPKDFPICICGAVKMAKVITRKPLTAGDEELEKNKRARSAKLRICERV